MVYLQGVKESQAQKTIYTIVKTSKFYMQETDQGLLVW